MGHAIHKHMNSFKASNDLKYNAIDDITQGDGAGDKGSAMKMNQAPTMKKGSMAYKQGYNAKLDESLGAKNGKKSQSLKDRRDESKGMEKSKGKGPYSSDSKMS